MKRAPLWLLAACVAGCATTPSADTGDQQVEVDSHVLLGDIALERQDFPTATREILAAAMLSDSPPYAERATRMAHELELTDVGLKAAERWHALAPEDERALWFAGVFEMRANRLPAAAGRLMQAELEALDKALGNPKRPVCAVVGGAKVSTKLDLLGNLVGKVDKLIIGGGMANTFMHAQGIAVGKSLSEKDLAKTALEILEKAKAANCKVLLPVDVAVSPEFKAGAPSTIVDAAACPADQMILDIGPKSIALYEAELAGCATLVWNGPLGAFEIKPFDAGTVALARTAARLTGEKKLLSVAGGGDTVAALEAAGVADQFTYISTAGGAFLEWMEGKTLPGVAALSAK